MTEPHIPVIDKSNREDGAFSRSDFTCDQADDLYRCPGWKELKRHRRAFSVPRIGPPPDNTLRYRASKADCDGCLSARSGRAFGSSFPGVAKLADGDLSSAWT